MCIGCREPLGVRGAVDIFEVQRNLVHGRLWQIDVCLVSVLSNESAPIGRCGMHDLSRLEFVARCQFPITSLQFKGPQLFEPITGN